MQRVARSVLQGGGWGEAANTGASPLRAPFVTVRGTEKIAETESNARNDSECRQRHDSRSSVCQLVRPSLRDLDRFKRVNDKHGHRVGDPELREIAVRLSASMRASDTARRHGGDEFVIL